MLAQHNIMYHNLVGLGTKYVFLHVGWVQNLNLFSVVFLLVSARATWDSAKEGRKPGVFMNPRVFPNFST